MACDARSASVPSSDDRRYGASDIRRWKVLVVCAHLRPGRTKGSTRYLMQPISGLHVASRIDKRYFDTDLYHEDWHGPFDTTRAAGYDLVFLSGLQPDFDRMRQLSYFFRRSGAKVVAGGSICTLFPEFASQFFDAVWRSAALTVFRRSPSIFAMTHSSRSIAPPPERSLHTKSTTGTSRRLGSARWCIFSKRRVAAAFAARSVSFPRKARTTFRSRLRTFARDRECD